ncbi:L-ascorbate peroxidase 1, cytosolic [Podochytrium sp. JEL0797]|nr:L-ascorbate peroxidase 1, cytosolic [Podochytrium sp. JEL0797]
MSNPTDLPQTMTFEGHSFPAGTLPVLAEKFENHLLMPLGCTPFSPDMPVDAPSRGLAALWLRAAFHDVGKFDPATRVPVGGLLAEFLNQTENAGITEHDIATRFAPQAKFPFSTADYIALAAQVSITHCGGPKFDFLQGRTDAPVSTPFDSLPALPDDLTDTYLVMKQKLQRLGFSNHDMVALVTGSHSLGGVHAINTPHATTKEFEAFDTTPGVFDNDVFKQVLKGNCRLNIDCEMAKDVELRPIVELFANNQTAFFEQYRESFTKMTVVGQNRGGLAAMHVEIGVHKNLREEGSIAAVSDIPSGPSGTLTVQATVMTTSAIGSVVSRGSGDLKGWGVLIFSLLLQAM